MSSAQPNPTDELEKILDDCTVGITQYDDQRPDGTPVTVKDYDNRVIDTFRLKSKLHAHMKAMLDDVIGPDIKLTMNGKAVKIGKTINVDLVNNRRESLKFIQDNARYVQQKESRQRSAKWLPKEEQ